MTVRGRLQDRFYPVFRKQPKLHHLELQPADGGQDGFTAGGVRVVEDLDDPLLAKLFDALLKLLVLVDALAAEHSKVFRGEAGDAGEAHGLTGTERISDLENTRVGQAHDVAGIRLFHQYPVLCEQLLRARQPDLTPQSRVL